MQMDADKEIAERALKLLKSLNTAARDEALRELDSIRPKLGNTRVDEHARADSWLAVCALSEALKPDGDRTSDISTLHRLAIEKTESWLATFR
jgi:hypothetical protein